MAEKEPEAIHLLVRLGVQTKQLDIDLGLGPKIPHGLRFQTIIPEEDIEDFIREHGFEPTPERKRLVHERLAQAGREAIAFAGAYTNWKGLLSGQVEKLKGQD